MSLKFATIPQKRLLQGISSSATSFYLDNILSFDGLTDIVPADLGSVHYCAFRNDTGTVLELMEIDPATISSGPITINKRGLSFYGDLTTQDTDLKLDWPANTIVMLGTDVPQIFQWLKEYIDTASIAGAVPMTPSVSGIARLNKTADDPTTPYVVGANDIVSYAADSVGTDSYAITPSPAITAYATGQMFRFKAGTANTGACTLNVNGLGARTIKKNVSEDLATGDILASQIIEVIYDGTNMQIVSPLPPLTPVVRTYTLSSSTWSSTSADSTSRFDITNPSGTTFRYTWDGTGTNPNISSATFPVGYAVAIYGKFTFSVGNTGVFEITGSGTNYFEVTNASGVAENDKTVGDYLRISPETMLETWTKPTGLKYVVVEVQGAGGSGGGVESDDHGGGGGGGGYAKKIIATASLSSTETVHKAIGGYGYSRDGVNGLQASFGSHLSATGGQGGDQGGSVQALGGVGTGGDINLGGSDGDIGNGSTATDQVGGHGGDSFFGGGGSGTSSGSGTAQKGNNYGGGGGGASGTTVANVNAGDGAPGIVIVTEYY